jgi:hypothetical protein
MSVCVELEPCAMPAFCFLVELESCRPQTLRSLRFRFVACLLEALVRSCHHCNFSSYTAERIQPHWHFESCERLVTDLEFSSLKQLLSTVQASLEPSLPSPLALPLAATMWKTLSSHLVAAGL